MGTEKSPYWFDGAIKWYGVSLNVLAVLGAFYTVWQANSKGESFQSALWKGVCVMAVVLVIADYGTRVLRKAYHWVLDRIEIQFDEHANVVSNRESSFIVRNKMFTSGLVGVRAKIVRIMVLQAYENSSDTLEQAKQFQVTPLVFINENGRESSQDIPAGDTAQVLFAALGEVNGRESVVFPSSPSSNYGLGVCRALVTVRLTAENAAPAESTFLVDANPDRGLFVQAASAAQSLSP